MLTSKTLLVWKPKALRTHASTNTSLNYVLPFLIFRSTFDITSITFFIVVAGECIFCHDMVPDVLPDGVYDIQKFVGGSVFLSDDHMVVKILAERE